MHRLAAASIAGLFALMPAAALPDTAGFEGETLTIIVGFGAGGGYDATARLFARHLGRHLDGAPDVIVQNMPGAGSLVAANHLHSVSPRDGTVLGVIGGGSVLEGALGRLDSLDARAFTWIGGRTAENSVCLLTDRTPVASLDDAQQERVIVGASGAGARSAAVPVLLNAVLGTRFEVILGYAGSNEIAYAMETGEVDGQCGIAWGTVRQRYGDEIAAGSLRVVSQFGLERAADLPDLPLASELAQGDLDRQALEFIQSDALIAWPLVAPPEVPAARAEALRTAFAAMLEDAAFLVETEALGLDVAAVTGEAIEALVAQLYDTPEPVKEVVRGAFAE